MRTDLKTRHFEGGWMTAELTAEDLAPYGLKVRGTNAWVEFLTEGHLAGYFEAYGGIEGGIPQELVRDLRTALNLPTPNPSR